MKTIYVTPKLYPQNFKKAKNLGQLIALFEKQGENDRLYVVKVNVNGCSINRDEESMFESMSVEEINDMTIHYSTLAEIVLQLLQSNISLLQSMQIQAIRFGQDYRQAAEEVPDHRLNHLLIDCRTFIESLEQAYQLHSNQLFYIRHISLWKIAESEFSNILQSIFQTQQWGNAQILCDLVEYDLTDSLENWEDILYKELLDNPRLKSIFCLKTERSNRDNSKDA